MDPPIGSVEWRRQTLRAEADRLMESSCFHAEQAVRFPFMADVEAGCIARCVYAAEVLRTVADALWPPERGLDLGPIITGIGIGPDGD